MWKDLLLNTLRFTFAVLHDDYELVVDSEEFLVPYQEGYFIFFDFVIQVLQNLNLIFGGGTYP